MRMTLLGLLLEQVHRFLMVLGHGRHVALIECLAFQPGKLGANLRVLLASFGRNDRALVLREFL